MKKIPFPLPQELTEEEYQKYTYSLNAFFHFYDTQNEKMVDYIISILKMIHKDESKYDFSVMEKILKVTRGMRILCNDFIGEKENAH